MQKFILSIAVLALIISSCQTTYQLQNFDYPTNVDTNTKQIEVQQKKAYTFPEMGIYADNQFDGARLNDFTRTSDSTFNALILPENEPINESPWYAFKMWSSEPKNLWITLDYNKDYKHRYVPKISRDRINWSHVSDDGVILNEDSTKATFSVDISKDTLWISGQELITSNDVKSWIDQLSPKYRTEKVAGKSTLERDIPVVHFVKGEAKGKKLLVLLSRQHPPEVTGYLALKAFMNRITKWDDLSEEFLDKYNILMFPILNPDGVDMGHWRHNAGGIDTNRDWGYYRQPEIRQVTEYIIQFVNDHKNKVRFSLDFHSTQEDVYYTMDNTLKTKTPGFSSKWLEGINNAIFSYTPNEEASGLEIPISKTWFFKQFQAESVTFEFGDETDREFIKEKATVAAEEMMKILLDEY